ncbi:MAG: O-antigen ligase family protein, partial [Acidobacteria bacterium]|nr:O-antigen ligase family protein [Acidobacteriota bacterium]
MDRETVSRRLAWTLLGLILLGAVWFGAVEPAVKPLFAAAALLLAGGSLLLVPARHRPGLIWTLAAAGFPLWLAIQLVPLPASVVGLLNPRAAAWSREFWPGPLTGCAGEALLAAAPPSLITLSVDRFSTWFFLFTVTAGLMTYLTVRSVLAGDRPGRRAAIATVAIFTAIEALYGLFQWTSSSPMVLWLEKDAYLDSATGTLINRNHFALMLYLGLGCTLTLLLERTARHEWQREAPGRATARTATLALLAGLQIFGVIASKSRAGLAGMLLVVVVGAVLVVGRPELRSGRAVGLLLIALLVIPALLLAGPALMERQAALHEEWTAEAGRGAVWRAGLGMISDFPLTGSGGATFEEAFRFYRPPEIQAAYDYAHNDYLQLMIETGFLGLFLALLPVALVALPVVRGMMARRRHGDRDTTGTFPSTTTWPLWAALLAVALHELVDFGLQIPSNLLLVAFLAGALSGPWPHTGLLARPAPRLAGSLAAAAIALSAVALLFSAAQWKSLSGTLRFPDLPTVRQAEASESMRNWRRNRKDPEPLCRAIASQARAQELRPLGASYAVQQAAQLIGAIESDAIGRAQRGTALDEASHAADRARLIDPWNAGNRRSLVTIDLALGQLDDAFDDAAVAARLAPDNTAQLVRTMLDAGIPGPLVGEKLGSNGRLLNQLLSELGRRGDRTSAGLIVAKDVAATPETCQAGGEIRNVLKGVHGVDGEPFLRSCLALFERAGDAQYAEFARAWLVNDLIESRQLEEARELFERMEQTPSRWWTEHRFAIETKDWDRLIRVSRNLLRV